MKWSVPVDGWGQPVAVGDRVHVVVAGGDGFALAVVDRASGRQLATRQSWWSGFPGTVLGPAPSLLESPHGTVVNANDGRLLLVDLTTGQVEASYRSPSGAGATTDLVLTGDQVWFASGSEVVAVRLPAMSEAARVTVCPGAEPLRLGGGGDTLIIRCPDEFVAIHTGSRAVKWRLPAPTAAAIRWQVSIGAVRPFLHGPVIHGDQALLLIDEQLQYDRGGRLVVAALASGEIRWELPLSDELAGVGLVDPVVVADHLVFGYELTAVDLDKRRVAWRNAVRAKRRAAVRGNELLVAAGDSTLYAIDVLAGQPRKLRSFPSRRARLPPVWTENRPAQEYVHTEFQCDPVITDELLVVCIREPAAGEGDQQPPAALVAFEL